MVKVGFICEGETEKLIIESEAFKTLLAHSSLELILAIDAKGNGNLLPHNIEKFIAILEDARCDKIFILTDLDKDSCITFTKQRVSAREKDIIIVAVKQIEAWFLSDTQTLSGLFKAKFQFEFPENENEPYDTLNTLFVNHTGSGNGKKNNGGKIKTARKMINNGFSVVNAAAHPNCSSAKYFLQKLK
jgi:hypothetical protein